MSEQAPNVAFIKHIYDTNIGMLSLADSKASLSLTVQSLILTISLGSTLFTNIFAELPDMDQHYQILYAVLIAIFILNTLLGVITAILVFKDRSKPYAICEDTELKKEYVYRILSFCPIKQKTPEMKKSRYDCKGLTYYRQIRGKYRTSDDYTDAIIKMTGRSDETIEYSHQVYNIAFILEIKFLLVKRSIQFLFANIVLAILILASTGIILLNGFS